MPPTHATKVHDYSLDTSGTYPITVGLAEAGVDRDNNTPPEWKHGAVGYSKRFSFEPGTKAVGTPARCGLSEVLRGDSIFYRGGCISLFPRFSHAVLSIFTARRGIALEFFYGGRHSLRSRMQLNSQLGATNTQ